jgi:hypothetical protein
MKALGRKPSIFYFLAEFPQNVCAGAHAILERE